MLNALNMPVFVGAKAETNNLYLFIMPTGSVCVREREIELFCSHCCCCCSLLSIVSVFASI